MAVMADEGKRSMEADEQVRRYLGADVVDLLGHEGGVERPIDHLEGPGPHPQDLTSSRPWACRAATIRRRPTWVNGQVTSAKT